jgi:PmbA protein
MERRVDLALAVERAARERDSLITNVEDTVYSDAQARAALANSNGFCDSYEETQCYAFAYAFAGDGPDRMTGMGFGVGRGPDDLDPGHVGREAADRALALHGARQPESRRCPVVLDPFVAASFASIIGRTLSADAVQRGRSLFADREGERIASPAFRLTDDGVHPEGCDRALRRRGGRPADDAADRGRCAAHLPVRRLHGAQGGPRVDLSAFHGVFGPARQRR